MATSAIVRLGLYDRTARADGTPTADQEYSFAPASNLAEPITEKKKYATLEQDYFLLDGSFEAFSKTGGGFGFWGLRISAGDGYFYQEEDGYLRRYSPEITITFTSPHTSTGLTFHFDRKGGSLPEKFICRWYDREGSTLAVQEAYPDSNLYFLDKKVEGYYRIELTFEKMKQAWQYLKIDGIEYGGQVEFSGDRLVDASVLEETDISCGSLSVNTLDFTAFSGDGSFSLMNRSGKYSAIQQGQKAEAFAIRNGETIPFGVYYLNEWESSGINGVHFTAVDAVGVLEKMTFRGDIYQNIRAGELVRQIFDGTELEYTLDSVLAEKRITGHLPKTDRRQALQQVAFAVGGVVRSDRMGVVIVEPPKQSAEYMISSDRKFTGQSIRLSPAISEIDVSAHQYTLSDMTQVLYEQELNAGRYTVEFTSPSGSLSAENAVILDSSANHAEIEVAQSGVVRIQGSVYTETLQAVRVFPQLSDSSSTEEPVTVEQATLLDSALALEAAQRLERYYDNRCICDFGFLANSEQVGSVVVVEGSGSSSLRGWLEQIETNLAKGLTAQATVRGKWIEKAEEIYAGEGFCGEVVF